MAPATLLCHVILLRCAYAKAVALAEGARATELRALMDLWVADPHNVSENPVWNWGVGDLLDGERTQVLDLFHTLRAINITETRVGMYDHILKMALDQLEGGSWHEMVESVGLYLSAFPDFLYSVIRKLAAELVIWNQWP